MVARLRDLLRVDHGARAAEERVTSDVVDMEVGVDERRDVGGREPAGRELGGNRLFGRLLRQLEGQHAAHVIEIDAGIEQVQPIVALDEHAVDGDARLRPGHVPQQLRVLDHDGAVVEQPDLHDSSALRTATSLRARSPRSSAILSGV